MTDLAAIRERHVEASLPPYRGRPRRGTQCPIDQQSWPCDTAQLLALLADTPSVEPDPDFSTHLFDEVRRAGGYIEADVARKVAAALVAPSVEPLDVAWREAESAAQQAGWRVNALTRTYEGQTWTANAQLVVPKGQPRHDQRQQNAKGRTPAEALTRLAVHFKESIGYPDRLLPAQSSSKETVVIDPDRPWDHPYDGDPDWPDRCIHCGEVGSYAHTDPALLRPRLPTQASDSPEKP